MINKESHRRKIEGSKKESRRHTRKTESESRGYAKKDRGKVESRRQAKQNTGKERLKRIGSEKIKTQKYMFHLENRQQQRKQGRKRWK